MGTVSEHISCLPRIFHDVVEGMWMHCGSDSRSVIRTLADDTILAIDVSGTFWKCLTRDDG